MLAMCLASVVGPCGRGASCLLWTCRTEGWSFQVMVGTGGLGGGYPHLQAAFSGEQADSQAWGLLGLAMSGPHPQTHSAPGTPVLWAILGLKVPLGAQSGSSFWECCPQG